VKPGEWVEGITGVVITIRPGISKVLAPTMLGDNPSVRVSPGEVLYTLHYMGKGYDLVWFRGAHIRIKSRATNQITIRLRKT